MPPVNLPDGGQHQIIYNDYCRNGDCRSVSLPVKTLSKISTNDGQAIDTNTYHDGLGRKIQNVTKGEANNFIVTRIHYDAMGRVAFESGPFFQSGESFLGNSQWMAYSEQGYDFYPGFDYPYVHTTYDKQGRPQSKTSRDGQNDLTITSYAHSGFAWTTTDPDKSVRKEIHDHLDRIIEVVEDPNGKDIHTRYLFNAASDLTEVRNALWNSESPNDNRIKMAYDTIGRKEWMDDPDLGYWQYKYDPNGNMTLQTDAKSKRIKFNYDELNRLTSKDFLDTSDADVTYTYDKSDIPFGIGRLYKITNGDVSTVVTAYDPMGRRLVVQKSISGAASRTMEWDYDIAGRVQRLTYPYTENSNPFYVDHSYHPGTSLLHSVVGSNGSVFAQITQYQPSGKMGALRFGNDISTNYKYDGWSQRLTRYQTTRPGGGSVQDRQYSYSPAGDITDIDDLVWGEHYYYDYDKLHRLTSETTSNGSTGLSPGIFEFAYNDLDHLHAVSEIISAGRTHALEYDANGNMTEGPDLTDPLAGIRRSISFNTDNMPRQVIHPTGGTITLAYDGEGKRAKKTGPTGTTYYFSNEFELRGTTPTCYIFAGNLRVAMVENNKSIKYFHKDHLGSSSAISLADGSIHEQTRYMPYGGQRGEGSGITASTYKFTDQELDNETGFYNFDARLYDPTIACFISPDTLVPDFSNPKTLNRYAYALNNPLTYNDPDGHIPVETILDFLSIAQSAYSLISDPSWGNTGFLAWDIAAAAVPYMPGSYSMKGLKVGSKIADGVSETAEQVAKNADTVVETAGKVADDVTDATKKTGRQRNYLEPKKDADGPHSTFRRNDQGQVTTHEEWKPNPKNPTGWDSVKRTDTQHYPKTHTHRNKKTGQDVPIPHTQGKDIPGGVRPATPDELP